MDELAVPIFTWGEYCSDALNAAVRGTDVDFAFGDARADRSFVHVTLQACGSAAERGHPDVCHAHKAKGMRWGSGRGMDE